MNLPVHPWGVLGGVQGGLETELERDATRQRARECARERDRARGKEGRRMCEQQRCISVQRSIHRVEVNARPYSGPRKEREGSEGLGGVRGAWRSGKGDRGQALSGKNEQTFRKTRKGTWSVPTPPLHPLPPNFHLPPLLRVNFHVN